MTKYILALIAFFFSHAALAQDAAPAPQEAAKVAAPVAPVAPQAAPVTPPPTAEQRVIMGGDAGVAAAAAADPSEAPEVTELKKKALAGDGEAQAELGKMYAEGDYYVERNYDEALKWHQMGADNAVPASQYYIGFIHEKGIGVTQNSQEAFKWFMKAAAQGDVASQGWVGKMYANGRGVEQDWRLAYFWLSVSNKNGDATYDQLRAKAEANVPKRVLKKINGRVAAWKPVKGQKTPTVDPAEFGLDGD